MWVKPSQLVNELCKREKRDNLVEADKDCFLAHSISDVDIISNIYIAADYSKKVIIKIFLRTS